jgi:hypothetical protein
MREYFERTLDTRGVWQSLSGGKQLKIVLGNSGLDSGNLHFISIMAHRAQFAPDQQPRKRHLSALFVQADCGRGYQEGAV